MKRSLIAAVVGLAATVATTFGQGHVQISNYLVSPYSQVIWANTVAGVGTANQSAQNASAALQLTLWYGKGNLADANLLTAGPTFGLLTTGGPQAYNPGNGNGVGGYYFINASIPTWVLGDTFTFQLRATGTAPGGQYTYSGSSTLFTQSAQITDAAVPAGTSTAAPGLTVNIVPVPEPSTFALAGLGSAALLIFRRKK